MALSASLFESAFDSSPIGHYLLSPTPEAIILAVNDAFLKATGRSREDLLGVSLFVAFPPNPDDPLDTAVDDLRDSLARVAATGMPDKLPAQRYPIPVTLPSGETVFEERFWSNASIPIYDVDGRIRCISHTTSDVTARVRDAAALRETEARFRALTNATADVVYSMSPDWRQMRELQGGGFLKDTESSNGFWLDEYIPEQEQARVHAAIDEAIGNKAVFQLEHRVRRADGTEGWTLSRAVPMLDADGGIVEWIGAASDITERKSAEEKLRDSDRRKDEFLAMLAHELRNPLAPIGAAAALLQHTRVDAALLQKTSSIIGRQVAHMTELIDDLLDVSRVTRGLVELDRVPLDIRSIVADAVEQVTPLIRARRQQLGVHVPPQAGLVMGDKKRLVQVLANILNNAAKYTQEGGMLELHAAPAHAAVGDTVVVDVVDNGIGMAPELAARAFELFAQAERSSDRSSGGLGLGLALVKSLVELHGGSVACDSPGPGLGSTFSVSLPRLEDVAVPADVQDGADVPLEGAGGLRVMVVDDNVDAASTLAMLLDAFGHQVTTLHAPEPAIDAARRILPQACVLDIGLPGMDGNELARRLRAQPETAGAMLIAVTGYGQQADRDQAMAAGFDHYLVKPIDTGKLLDLLASAA
jgi:signal transduction histidine kinase